MNININQTNIPNIYKNNHYSNIDNTHNSIINNNNNNNNKIIDNNKNI